MLKHSELSFPTLFQFFPVVQLQRILQERHRDDQTAGDTVALFREYTELLFDNYAGWQHGLFANMITCNMVKSKWSGLPSLR